MDLELEYKRLPGLARQEPDRITRILVYMITYYIDNYIHLVNSMQYIKLFIHKKFTFIKILVISCYVFWSKTGKHSQ